MKNIFHIACWEFNTRIKSKTFIFSTFILPIMFVLFIILPVLIISYDSDVVTKLIGIINLNNRNDIVEGIQSNLNRNYRLEDYSPEYIILPISVENSIKYKNAMAMLSKVDARKDSITKAYDDIKNLRAKYFRQQNLPYKEYLLQKSYEEMIPIREDKDLAEIEYNNYIARLDSVYESEARSSADSLLMKQVINAYLVIPEDIYEEGYIEYHALNPGNLLESERIEKVINQVIIPSRLTNANINTDQITQFLEPVQLKKFQLYSKGPKEWNFYIEFYGSVIGVVLLFMAIFTSGGFLFTSVLREKTNRVIEILLSYANSQQIMAGKILGLGFLGLMQVLIWLVIAAIFVSFDLFGAAAIKFLSMGNALYFLLYFSLGYMLYASIFITIGSVFSSEQEAQQVNLILRTIAIIPVLLVLFFLKEPDSVTIKYLSYFPLLTPYLMIMKISQYTPSLTLDVYITCGILIVSIIIMVFVAAKIFRLGILMYGKKLTLKQILLLLKYD
jgi:ABC-2 type transport system permease protein